jgi:hypothetical protein
MSLSIILKLNIILYKIQLSFFSFEISLFQKITILNFIHNISIGVLPTSTGLNYLWNQQQPVHSVQLKFIVKQNLTGQYIQNWFNQIENSSRGEFYGIFKNEFNLDKYLLKLDKI